MGIIYGGAGGGRGRGGGREGSGKDMHSHKYAVRFGLVSLEMVNCLVWIIVNTL
jgi:hypothetical protein